MPKKNPLNSGNPKPKGMAILSESVGDNRSVQRLTAQAERRRLGTHCVNTAGRMTQKLSRPTKICLLCNKPYTPTGNCQKRCYPCQIEHTKTHMKDYHKKHYVPKGYNQYGEANNNWKGGIGVYRRLLNISECGRCGDTANLCVHHKDQDRYNNDTSNLECLCKRCHQIEHKCYENLPDKTVTIAARKRFMQEHAPELFGERGKFKKIRKV